MRATDEIPAAVPYRPTVSTPAALSAPGWLEAEFGGLHQHERHVDSIGANRTSLPYTVKYAVTDDWNVRLGGELFAHASAVDGTRTSGVGDTALVLKRRFVVDPASAFGIEVGGAFPTARAGVGLGSGKPDWSLNGIYSVDVGALHADVNLVDTRLGAKSSCVARLQTLGAFALSAPLTAKWTVEGEISGTRQHGVAATGQVLAALSRELRRDLVVDFGVAHGTNRASPTWQAFAGMTIVVGRL